MSICKRTIAGFVLAAGCAFAAASNSITLKVLATSKTSTMEKELNDAAQQGFAFSSVMGGETAFGGKEIVVVMARQAAPAQKRYRLVATSKTSTAERELQSAAQEGYEYKGQTVYESSFGGREVVLILERDMASGARPSQYKLVATSKTSSLERELAAAGADGYDVMGMTVSKTAFGGSELVCIMRKAAAE